jgi:hypothetical protein
MASGEWGVGWDGMKKGGTEKGGTEEMEKLSCFFLCPDFVLLWDDIHVSAALVKAKRGGMDGWPRF